VAIQKKQVEVYKCRLAWMKRNNGELEKANEKLSLKLNAKEEGARKRRKAVIASSSLTKAEPENSRLKMYM
jgi:hypothetical protein